MSKKFLTLNIGASAIALAEYEAGSGGALTLVNYGLAPLAAPIDVGNADTILSPAIMQIVREKGIRPGRVAVSVSGQMAFLRPAAIAMAGGEEKFEQMVRYEIEQNIPFPLDEMVCDRQILGDTENGDKAVLIVAAKIEQIEAVTNAVMGAGFTPDIVDVAPVALTNAQRGILGDDGSCTVMLDIGAKTTTLVISEGEKIYNRAIPVAGNTITKDIAQALGCTLEEAEQIKRDSAYVSMGGVTEDDDPTLDRISKVCRAVLTRLQAEISRSINFYRSQQHGSAPSKLYITGGTALLPQIDTFFADSLGIEVEFFNPFAMMSFGNAVNQEQLGTEAAMLSATAGLAVRAAGNAPISINLLPPALVEQRAEVKRIPVVAVGAASLVAACVCGLLGMNHSIDVVNEQQAAIQGVGTSVQKFEKAIKAAQAEVDRQTEKTNELLELLYKRAKTVAQLNTVRQAIGNDLWIESWDKGVVTIRGWKDRSDAFVDRAKAKGAKETTAQDLVIARLKANAIVVPESVAQAELKEPNVGKGDSVEQFAVKLEFMGRKQ